MGKTNNPIKQKKFNELPATCLRADELLPFDVYIERDGNTILWRGQETAVTQADVDILVKSGVKTVYIGIGDKGKYLEYAEKNVLSIVKDKNIPLEFKSFIMSQVANAVLDNLFKDPTNHLTAKRLENVVMPLVELLLANDKVNALRFLIERGDMVFSYVPHSARTCYYTIALAETFDIFSDKKLYQLGIAALLHDIGQTLVATEIREKIGKYTDDERAEMQRHPIYSVELIHRSGMVSIDKAPLAAVKAHHELGDATGYPHKISLFTLPLEAQILAVTHTFESLTIERIHREAKRPYDVIKFMLSNPNKYPVKIVRRFIDILGKLESY
ncbi:MAG: HD-GYP domain-containing protein [Candidatus Anammoxibacter sp.]